MIPRQTVDEILSKTDIAALVGQRVTLKRAGQVFKGLCPFHAEKTPSFTVSPKRGSFHCFGCGASGDALAFVMQMDNLTFREAALELAAQAGVEVQEAQGADAGEVGRMASVRRRYFDLLTRAGKLWAGALWGAQGQKARAYLAARGVSEAQARAWGLGFAPVGLVGKMAQAGVSREDQVLSGLVSVDEDGRVSERFRGRLVFPVKDAWGRIIGFSGRTLDDVGQDGRALVGVEGAEVKTYGPKYVNSPETPWYKKGEALLGLDLARDVIRQEGFAVLVEGNFDALAAQAAGLGAVAPCGTALTAAQARALARVTDQVCVAFDGDKAGRAASVRAVEVLRSVGLRVKVASLPQGLDPATMDPARLQEAVREAVAGTQYVLAQMIEPALGADVEARVAAKDAALEVVAQEPEENLRRHWAEWVAQRLRLVAVVPAFDPKAQAAQEAAQAEAALEAQAAAARRPFDAFEARLVRLLAQSPRWHLEFWESGLMPTLQDEALVLFVEVAGQMAGEDHGWAKAARWVEQETGREGMAARLAGLAAKAEAQVLDGEAFTGVLRHLVHRYIVAQREMTFSIEGPTLGAAMEGLADLERQTSDALDWVCEPWDTGKTPSAAQDLAAQAQLREVFGALREQEAPVQAPVQEAVVSMEAPANVETVAPQTSPASALLGVVPVLDVIGAQDVAQEARAWVVDDRPAPRDMSEPARRDVDRPARHREDSARGDVMRGVGAGADAGAAALGAPRAAPPMQPLAQTAQEREPARVPASWRIVDGGRAQRGGDGARGQPSGSGMASGAAALDDGWDVVSHDAPKIARAGP